MEETQEENKKPISQLYPTRLKSIRNTVMSIKDSLKRIEISFLKLEKSNKESLELLIKQFYGFFIQYKGVDISFFQLHFNYINTFLKKDIQASPMEEIYTLSSKILFYLRNSFSYWDINEYFEGKNITSQYSVEHILILDYLIFHWNLKTNQEYPSTPLSNKQLNRTIIPKNIPENLLKKTKESYKGFNLIFFEFFLHKLWYISKSNQILINSCKKSLERGVFPAVSFSLNGSSNNITLFSYPFTTLLCKKFVNELFGPIEPGVFYVFINNFEVIPPIRIQIKSKMKLKVCYLIYMLSSKINPDYKVQWASRVLKSMGTTYNYYKSHVTEYIQIQNTKKDIKIKEEKRDEMLKFIKKVDEVLLKYK